MSNLKPTEEERALCAVVNLLEGDIRQEHFIATEVPFANRSRRADLVMVGKATWGIEVKSPADKIENAIAQLEDYRQFFDFVVLASTPEQIKRVFKDIPRQIGLIELSGATATWRRVPLAINRHNKAYLAGFLDRSTLQSLLSSQEIERDSLISVLRNLATKHISTSVLQTAMKERMTAKMRPHFQQFIQEFNGMCWPDDLDTIRYRDEDATGFRVSEPSS